MNKIEKQIEIAQTIKHAALNITSISATIPNTGKNKNIFIKAYNRRPQNKKKTAQAFGKMALSSLFSAIQISTIKDTPTPKYKGGGIMFNEADINRACIDDSTHTLEYLTHTINEKQKVYCFESKSLHDNCFVGMGVNRERLMWKNNEHTHMLLTTLRNLTTNELIIPKNSSQG